LNALISYPEDEDGTVLQMSLNFSQTANDFEKVSRPVLRNCLILTFGLCA